jgi:hypothetical protein
MERLYPVMVRVPVRKFIVMSTVEFLFVPSIPKRYLVGDQ